MNNVTRDGGWDLTKRRRVPSSAQQLDRYRLMPGDVLFNATNSPDLVGKTALLTQLDEPMVFSNHFIRLRARPDKIEPRYLSRWLQREFSRRTFQSMCRQWVNQATVGRDTLLALTLPLPPIEDQRRIADILDRADALRAKRREALALIDDLTQSIFLDMFGDPVLERTPWPVQAVGDLLESAQYGTSAKAGAVGKFPILRMGNLTTNGRVDLADLKYIDLPPRDEAKYTVREGDVLFNRTNSAELVGKTAVYREHKSMAFAGYLVRLRVREPHRPEYVSAFLNGRYGKAVLRSIAKSIVGMANINAKEVQGIRLGVPPAPLQAEFAEHVKRADAARARRLSNLVALDELFASLQQTAFAGLL